MATKINYQCPYYDDIAVGNQVQNFYINENCKRQKHSFLKKNILLINFRNNILFWEYYSFMGTIIIDIKKCSVPRLKFKVNNVKILESTSIYSFVITRMKTMGNGQCINNLSANIFCL